MHMAGEAWQGTAGQGGSWLGAARQGTAGRQFRVGFDSPPGHARPPGGNTPARVDMSRIGANLMVNGNGSTATLAATDAAVPTLHIRRLSQAAILVPIIGTAPLIMHKFSAKAKRQMLDAMQGRKTPKEPKDPERDFQEAAYLDDEGGYGMPSLAFKSAIVEASRFFDKSVSKVLLRQALFVRGVHSKAAGLALLPITAPTGPIMREDVTRVGISGTDLRYRPEFSPWSTVLPVQYVSSMLTQDSVLSLIEAAGMGCGVGEWRPERSGDFGTFSIDPDRAVESVPIEALS